MSLIKGKNKSVVIDANNTLFKADSTQDIEKARI